MTLKITENELIEKDGETRRYPNLSTVLMVESYLKKHRDIPISFAELKRKLPKQIMHQTLKLIIIYLWKSGKIIYGPRGIQWIFSEPEHLRKMLDGSIEV